MRPCQIAVRERCESAHGCERLADVARCGVRHRCRRFLETSQPALDALIAGIAQQGSADQCRDGGYIRRRGPDDQPVERFQPAIERGEVVACVDPEGRVNLAPFSFFNAFGANPPVVVFSPTNRRDGSRKDTLLNLEAVPESVRTYIRDELVKAPSDVQGLVEKVAMTAAAVTQNAAVASAPQGSQARMKHVDVVSLEPTEGLLILLLDDPVPDLEENFK